MWETTDDERGAAMGQIGVQRYEVDFEPVGRLDRAVAPLARPAQEPAAEPVTLPAREPAAALAPT